MSRELPPIAYVVLALIGSGGAGAHDLVDMMRRGGRIFYAAAPSQVYAESKRLAEQGYLDARRGPGRRGERTVYTLTEQGRVALVAWLEQPARFPRIQNEANLRLTAGDLLGDAAVLRSLAGMREQIAAIAEGIGASEQRLAELPHRERYLRLSYSLARRILAAHLEWLDEVERTLGAEDDRDPSRGPSEPLG